MLASWVRQTTTTTGTGTITLDGTPDSDAIGFSDAFNDGDRVQYVIEDGNNRESGTGTLSSGTDWTLTRDLVLETLSSGSYSRMPATGITLSGSAVVGIAADASMVLPSYGNLIDSTSNVIGILPSGLHGGTTTQTTSIVSDRVYSAPFTLASTTKVNALKINVSVSAPSSTVAGIGIYACDENMYPDALLADVSISVQSTGTKTGTLATALKLMPGTYWAAVYADTNVTIRGDVAASGTHPSAADLFCRPTALYKTVPSITALPDPFGTSTSYVATIPRVVIA